MKVVTFKELAELLQLPRQLYDHLIWVAGTGELLCDHWNGPAIHRKMLRRVLLLHDAGNIVKIDAATLEEKRLKRIFSDRFGHDDHKASERIGRAAGLSEAELSLMSRKIFLNNQETMAGDDWTSKVGAYADQRAAPNGIMPLLERLNEAKKRYRDRPGTSMNNSRTDALINCAAEIEKQLLENLSIPALYVTTERVEQYRSVLEKEQFVLTIPDVIDTHDNSA